MNSLKTKIILVLFPLVFIALAPCHNNQIDDEKRILTIYTGRSESLVDPILKQFEESTGIRTRIKYGGTSELASTILEEGKETPADIFFAQDPAGLGSLEHRFATIPDDILSSVDYNFKSEDKKWIGLSGRIRTIVYNTEKILEKELPDDIFGFTNPRWKEKIGWPPTNGSFQAMVTAMRKIWGEEKTKDWLVGIKNNNPSDYPNNTTTVKAVENGEVEVGFVNHYYLYRLMEEQGVDIKARNYYTKTGGPGSLIMVAGVGILDTSKNKENAVKFLKFMLSPVSQQFFASQNYEYPVVKGVKMNPMLPPLSEINGPQIKMSDMKDLRGTVQLLREIQIIP